MDIGRNLKSTPEKYNSDSITTFSRSPYAPDTVHGTIRIRSWISLSMRLLPLSEGEILEISEVGGYGVTRP